ncbi:uncharacterized protein V6R79_004539 [Siganus canaliculatus]
MSKKGRRRNSRRKSSSSSKQSVSPNIFQKQRLSNSYRDDIVEKGETDCLRKESTLSGSEDEDKYCNDAPKPDPFKDRNHSDSFPSPRNIYTKTTEDAENGVKIVTSVSVSDIEDSPKIHFQQSHQPSHGNLSQSSAPLSNITTINYSGSHMKLQIQEMLYFNSSGIQTTVVVSNDAECTETFYNSTMAQRESSERLPSLNRNQDQHGFTFRSTMEQKEAHADSPSARPTKKWDNYSQYCSDFQQQIAADLVLENPVLLNFTPRRVGAYFPPNCSADLWDIPPPQEFADMKCECVEELVQDLASCRISACSSAEKWPRQLNLASNASCTCRSRQPLSTGAEDKDLARLIHHFFDSDKHKHVIRTRSSSDNGYSFTKDFINYQKRKSRIRNNSVPAAGNRGSLLPKKRRLTFPWMSRTEGPGLMPGDLVQPCSGSFSSLLMFSLPFHSEGTGNPPQWDDSAKNPDEALFRNDCPKPNSVAYLNEVQPQGPGLKLSPSKSGDCGLNPDPAEVNDSGFDQEPGETECESPGSLKEQPSARDLAVRVTPPPCTGPEEQMSQTSQVQDASQEDPMSGLPQHSESAVPTASDGPVQPALDQTSDLQPVPGRSGPTGLDKPATSAETPLKEPSTRAGKVSRCKSQQQVSDARSEENAAVKVSHGDVSRFFSGSSDAKEHLKVLKEPDCSASEHWAKRRKLFKESKQWSSAGGSSITSDITEESISEDAHSMDTTVRDTEDRGFYTETFHSSAWIYQGDEPGSGTLPPSLNARMRVVSIRERTVRISKGAGEYPWGFRIQFSKPIVVTEVDTNGAAEEAGLTVGDYVLAVNGTDVTSIPHSEVADLARQGPDLLTLTIGSDIARGPNTPRPACRGYLHKRTQSGLIKGWRRRWFVLTHDSCFYYYRHKRDEGKRPALSAVKLEGAEVGVDVSLGKPFVFKCRPQYTSRVYFFCATSNQEMKRWLDAMEKAVHPITQKHVWVDVTRHNSNLPPLAVKNPDCLGLLHKLDRNKETWIQYYCILKDGCLSMYSSIRATHAHGGIYLQGYTVREQPYGSKKSTIELKPPSDEFKTFYFCAENPNENKRQHVNMFNMFNNTTKQKG